MKLDLLKDMMRAFGMKPLADKAGVSRTSLYNFLHGENFESETLSKVAKVLDVELGVLGKTPSLESVYNHLAYYKAPLLYDGSKPVTMSMEETTKWGLKFSQDDGMLESVMPFFLMKNFKRLSRAKLLKYLDEEAQFQVLGFYLDLAADYSKDNSLKAFAESFHENAFLPLYLGTQALSGRALEVLKSKSSALAKRWNLFSYGSLEDYFTRFKKWEQNVQ